MPDAPATAHLLAELRAAFAGQYDVERALGAGAMGTVFLARDTTLDRPVAIKVISPELAATRAFHQRFLNEARTVAKLRHPNIVAVHAAGEAAGSLYFVMEYVPGESLRDWIDRERGGSVARSIAILTELASALAYAHEHGVIHRDIKPENVLVDGESGRAMLTDFGVASLMSRAAGDDRITGTGMIVGSPRYMSPEQAAGERELDGRSDIYSLGLVGYEMFSGESAFSGTSAVSIITKQITEKPAPLGDKAPATPPAAAHAVDRALEKDPAARWQSAREFAQALGSDQGGALPVRRVAATPPRRRRLIVAAAIGATVLAAIPVVWRLSSGDRTPKGVDARKSFLVAPFENQTSDPSLGWLREGSVNMLTLNLASWRDLNVVDYERTLDLLRDAGIGEGVRVGLEDARRIARKAGVWTVVLGQITRGSDSLRVTARVYDVASGKQVKQAEVGAPATVDPRGLFDRLSRNLLDLAGAPPMTPDFAKTTTSSLEAYQAYLTGVNALNGWEFSVADTALARAVRADSTFALAHYKRALLLGWDKARVRDTIGAHSAGLAVRHGGRLPPRERGIVEAYLSLALGVGATNRGDTAAGRENLTAAQQKYTALLARDSSDAEAWYGLGDASFHIPTSTAAAHTANWTRSLRAFNRTLALDSTFHLAYPHTLQIYTAAATQGQGFFLAGDSLVDLASPADAERYGRDRIAAARQTARDRALEDARHWVDVDPDAPEARERLAEAYIAANDPGSAAASLRQAMARGSINAPDLPYRLATLELRAGTPAAALATLRDAMRRVPADSISGAGGMRYFGTLTGSAAVATHAGSIADMNAVLSLVDRAIPTLVIPGRKGVRTSGITKAFATLSLLAMGVDLSKLRVDVDAATKTFDDLSTMPEAKEARLIPPYFAYVLGRDTSYLATIRRFGGEGWVAAPAFQALSSLDRLDTARAIRVAAQFARGDTAKMRAGPRPSMLGTFVEAEVLAAIGDLKGATATYESIDPAKQQFSTNGLPDPRWPLYARTFLARGILYEQLGDKSRAEAAYSRFLDLWKEASDPRLQPQLRQAREGLARLRDS